MGMRRTASSERDGVVVTDRWGGHWRVSCHRAGVLPSPATPPDSGAVGRLLLPWAAPAEAPPALPRASWVLGRSVRWQGPGAPGASEDPLRDEAVALRDALGVTGGGPAALGLVLWARRTLQTVQRERTHPWLVQLCSADGADRWATWAVAGPEAAQSAVTDVAAAVGAGRLPEPVGARLLDVRDDRR